MHLVVRRALILASVMAISTLRYGLFAQATTSLRGIVTDAQKSAIGDAVVTLTSAGTGFLRTASTTTGGEYQFSQLPPGTYGLKVEKPGFAVSQNDGVKLEVNTPATLNLQLELGSTTTTVDVKADAATIDTVDGSVGNAFQEKQVRDLPLQTRNVVELLSIQPGVTQTGEVLGARRDQNNITLDGVDVNNNQNAGILVAQNNGSASVGGAGAVGNTPGFNAAIPVPLDSVQEFRVTVAGQGADEGRSSGGQVTLITKSGTNQLHGTLYEYNRNTLLAANDFFNNEAGIPRAALVRNQFGVSLGGPVIKDRVFFFANWERRIDASSQAQTATVPSQALRNGNLTVMLSSGQIATLGPADVLAMDPLHIGYSNAMKNYLNAFPTGNDPALSLDNGLNFDGLRFNTPLDLDQSAYVAKMDFNIDKAGKHTLAIRGTLNDGKTDVVGANLPGQQATSLLLDNSKGVSANYTWVARPNLVNTLTFGLTRLGLNNSGTTGTALSFTGLSSTQNFNYRPLVQIMPTTNVADNLTWTKSKHTITTGINFRFIRNSQTSYANSYPTYQFQHDALEGLGGDAGIFITNYVNQKLGTSGLTLADPQAAEDGLGNLLGLINGYSATYQFTKTGSIIPFGSPASREYAVNDYETYVQDSWRARKDLTITAGVRYSNPTVPWEVHGTEVVTTVPLQTYFAERVAAMESGTPNSAIKDALLTYTLGGPANGKPGWYSRSNLDFGPRFSFAYAPDSKDHWWSSVLGRDTVFRGGFALVYDQYGSDMITNINQTGSPGLASTVTQPSNTTFTTSPRYNGLDSLPALPAAPTGGFPFTPPAITGGFNEGVGVVSNLKAPYSMVINANYAKQLPSKLTLEIGYAGRLARRGLLQQDIDQPLTQFRDPASGTTWSQAAQALQADYLAAGQQYGPISNIPFIENMFPALRNAYVPGSATQNYYQGWIQQNGLSDEDNLNLSDRQRISGTNTCYTRTGCNTFYPLQFAGLPTWTNAGFSNYHALTVSLRRLLTNGIAFDFNYTLSHSIDNSSGAESGAGTYGAVLQDAFNTNSFRGSSDFDERHNITADLTYELPFGRNKMFLGSANKYLEAVVGGWQVSTIARYHSGLPTTISAGGVYPTNYEVSAIVNLLPGASNHYGFTNDNNGLPSLFSNTSAAANYFQQPGGTTGTRAILRLPGFTNFDIAAMKNFRMPFEGHNLQFRAEAFNAFNQVNLYNPSLDIHNTAIFGEFQSAFPARVMQASLRYSF